MNELLPAPDGPSTAIIGARTSRFARFSISRSRPTKRGASTTRYAARPGYGEASPPSSCCVSVSSVAASSRSQGLLSSSSKPHGAATSRAPRRPLRHRMNSSGSEAGSGEMICTSGDSFTTTRPVPSSSATSPSASWPHTTVRSPGAQPHVARVRIEDRHRLERCRADRVLHRGAERDRRGLPARRGILLERADHRLGERRRDALGQRRRWPAQVRVDQRGALGEPERDHARHAAIREHAERVDIGARIDARRIGPLLGRHVMRRAERRAVLGEVLAVGRRVLDERRLGRRAALARVGDALRDAEIDELGQQLPGALDHR